MRKLFSIAILIITQPQLLLAITQKTAGEPKPYSFFGSSYPLVSPHVRKSLELRNFVSDNTLEDTLQEDLSGLDCTLRQNKKVQGLRGKGHQQFRVICQGVPIFGAFVSRSGEGSKALNSWRHVPDEFSIFESLDNVLSEEEIRRQMAFENYTVTGSKLGFYYLQYENTYVPTYEMEAHTEGHQYYTVYVDANSGLTLDIIDRSFAAKLGYGYIENPFEDEVVLHTLPGISDSTDLLESEDFKVYGSSLEHTRAVAEGDLFNYLPEDEQFFDQVQAYISLTRAKSFLGELLPLGDLEPIELFTHTDLDNNAIYVPSGGNLGPRIYIGTADGNLMANLNRDSDVVIHEFSHHVIFQYLQSTRGDSLILHEGMADFFAYIINGNPRLAESILPGSPYLRTADLSPNRYFDQEKDYRGPHLLGQFWSALLWDLHLIDPELDKVIAKSMSYWTPTMSMQAAILALIHADQDHFGSKYRCQILQKAIERGFTEDTNAIDRGSCDVPPPSIPLVNDTDETPKRNCGAIGGSAHTGSLAILILLPGILFARRSHENRKDP
ncbi:MAG: hypothetical protein HRU19_05155 [Pseudobacteriovorax sp.]|nr:hypothetical protein [Pseudobacteriovorax sp.]